MQLLTVHRILIGSGVLVFAVYGIHQINAFANGDAAAIWHALLSASGAVTLLAYLRWLRRRNLKQ